MSQMKEKKIGRDRHAMLDDIKHREEEKKALKAQLEEKLIQIKEVIAINGLALEKNDAGKEKIIFCKNRIVQAIVTQKHAVCIEKSIDLQVDLDVPDVLPGIEGVHLCSVYGNLIDNAMRGIAHSLKGAKTIYIHTKIIDGYLEVICRNPLSVEALKKMKKARRGHGYGMRIVANIAKQYQGAYIVKIENGVWEAKVTLRMT